MSPTSLTTVLRLSSAFLMLAVATNALGGRLLHGSEPVQTGIHSADMTIRLEIPDTGQEKRRPEDGWCGEAAIQMAMSYFGAYASQQAINRAGRPVHPDLYSNEIPVAMRSLGLEFKPWRGDGLHAFLNWVHDELAADHPVLLGVKIYPTAHPEWGLDHFVLAVGCTKDSLTYNTTWKRQETRNLAHLSSQEKGLSFANQFDAYYGYAITGMKVKSAGADVKPTRIRIGRERDKEVELHIAAVNLEPGKRYRLVKFAGLAVAQQAGKAERVRSFVADGPKADFAEKIGIDDARVYRCVPEP